MKLAGANNDEIQLARVKHTETIAESEAGLATLLALVESRRRLSTA